MGAVAEQSKAERRGEPRVDGGNHLLWLYPGDGRTRIACFIFDISLTGARLKLSDDVELPGVVGILIGGAMHQARIVWRQTIYIGVEFIE